MMRLILLLYLFIIGIQASNKEQDYDPKSLGNWIEDKSERRDLREILKYFFFDSEENILEYGTTDIPDDYYKYFNNIFGQESITMGRGSMIVIQGIDLTGKYFNFEFGSDRQNYSNGEYTSWIEDKIFAVELPVKNDTLRVARKLIDIRNCTAIYHEYKILKAKVTGDTKYFKGNSKCNKFINELQSLP